ncbi:hypothetical protein AG1IA_08651 [Rhizoctonia solani AG-1 IA]|uniref:Uncharacterized protein n=1 Tax=Thanatephorus cucumeris (strain AG1-IA) TaxID=983506 RepID=L8WGM4_THACA|nr:hypothetical protein AG1IA_08651 [Rhizoctonia solani AG-1 IA]
MVALRIRPSLLSLSAMLTRRRLILANRPRMPPLLPELRRELLPMLSIWLLVYKPTSQPFKLWMTKVARLHKDSFFIRPHFVVLDSRIIFLMD